MDNTKRPTIGLALRGASLRSVFNIGLLEVLHEQGIPIDYIAALSSSTIVAAAYACGTLNQLRELCLNLDKEVLMGLLERSKAKTGVYSLDKLEELIRVYTRNQNFENVKPLMGFIAVDINRGEEVVLGMGDIAHAARVSCTLPWVFEPVEWGNRTLVDGGVVNMIPGDVVRRAGIDIIIGVDLRTSEYVFGKSQLLTRRALNFIRRLLLINQAEKLWRNLGDYMMSTEFFGQYPDLNDASVPDYPGKFGVLGRSMDLAVAAEQKQREDKTYGCDLIIRPPVPKLPWWKRYFQLDLFMTTKDINNARALYDLGRQTGVEYVPQIWQMMADYEAKRDKAEESLREMVKHNPSND